MLNARGRRAHREHKKVSHAKEMKQFNPQLLKKLSKDRSAIASHVVGLLKSFKEAATFNQMLTKNEIDKPELVSVSLAHMVVFTVRALETFFRDSFVSCIRQVDGFKEAILNDGRNTIKLREVDILLGKQVPFEEVIATYQRFQNLKAINHCFRPLGGKPIFQAIHDAKPPMFIYDGQQLSIWTKFSMAIGYPDWRGMMRYLFKERHEILHNANHPLPTDQTYILKCVEASMIFAQIFAICAASRMRPEREPKAGVLTFVTNYRQAMVGWAMLSAKDVEAFRNAVIELERQTDEKPELATEVNTGIGPLLVLPSQILNMEFEQVGRQSTHGEAGVHMVKASANGHLLLTTLYKKH